MGNDRTHGALPPESTEIILESISDGVFTVDHEWRVTSFNRAAEITNTSQPTVSRQVKRLQDVVGSQLFVSTPRGIKLTEKGEALAQALVSAYRRDTNISSNQHVEAIIDPTGGSQILLEKEVTETVENEQTEVALEVAREYHPEAQLGDTVMVPVETGRTFGRIAAQTAKQVILQRIREAERDSLYDEFVERQGDLVTGTVQSVSHGTLTISLPGAGPLTFDAQMSPEQPFVRELLLGEGVASHGQVAINLVDRGGATLFEWQGVAQFRDSKCNAGGGLCPGLRPVG